MKSRGFGGGRRATTGGTDGRSLDTALVASSLLLWVPYSLAAMYIAYCTAFIAEVPMAIASAGPGSTASISHDSVTGAVTASSSAGGQSYATSSATGAGRASASAVSSFGTAGGANVVSFGAASGAAPLHQYSTFYYTVFPAGFDLAVFVPLLLRVLSFSVVAVSVTYYLSVHKYNGGEYLMAVAWALGTFSEYGWLTSSTGSVMPVSSSSPAASAPTHFLISSKPPSWLWLAVSLVTGLFSGILCKVKDIVDGKHDRDTHLFTLFDRSPSPSASVVAGGSSSQALQGSRRRREAGDSTARTEEGEGEDEQRGSGNAQRRAVSSQGYRRIRMSTSHHLTSLGDRLYMVVPFCTGQWFAFILHHGWRGIIVENGTILLSLGLVGYTMLSYKLLKRQVLRASGRVTRSVAARGRTRRNQRRLREQQELQQQSATLNRGSVEARNAVTTSPSDAGLTGHTGESPASLSEEETEEEPSDFLEDVGEVAVIDAIDLISKLFTTSFGVVVLVVIGLNIFMTSLCIPFLKALFQLNALVSGAGIVIELIMYEVA